jgi:hypothetical protein
VQVFILRELQLVCESLRHIMGIGNVMAVTHKARRPTPQKGWGTRKTDYLRASRRYTNITQLTD